MASEFAFYVGVDWGTEAHQICVINAGGRVVCERSVEHSGEAINSLFGFLDGLTRTEPGRAAVAIEVPHGPVVEAFLERNYAVIRSISGSAYGCGCEGRSPRCVRGS